MDEDIKVFVPDPPPPGMDPVAAEWVIRQLRRITNTTEIVEETQKQQDGNMSAHAHTGSDGTVQVSHSDLLNRYTANQHRIANITDLEDELQALTDKDVEQDTELARLESVKMNTDFAVSSFSFAAYGGAECPLNTPFPNLGAAWQDLDIFTSQTVTPRGIVLDLVNGRFSVPNEGVYTLSLAGSMEHNSSNSGRVFYIRLYNYDDGVAIGQGLIIGTGRNAEATTIPISFLAEITATAINKAIGFQIGNGDAYTAVSFQTIGYDLNAEGEWRGVVT